jgi:hypothetical protein
LTRFFVPDETGRAAADRYDEIRRAAEERTGHTPLEKRIAALTCRRDGRDLETVVGEADPVCGDTVMAILDLGRHQPYLVHCTGTTDRRLLVSKPVYSVTEFTS